MKYTSLLIISFLCFLNACGDTHELTEPPLNSMVYVNFNLQPTTSSNNIEMIYQFPKNLFDQYCGSYSDAEALLNAIYQMSNEEHGYFDETRGFTTYNKTSIRRTYFPPLPLQVVNPAPIQAQ